MARARSIEQWNHTADLLAHLANLQRTDDRQKVHTRADHHPFMPKPPMPRTSDPADLVKREERTTRRGK